jgi:hypothetical protein
MSLFQSIGAFVAKVLSNLVTKNRAGIEYREIVVESSPGQMRSTTQFNPAGQDVEPLPGDLALVIPVKGKKRKPVVVGFIDPKVTNFVNRGENRIYSRDLNGNRKANVYCKRDGTLQFNEGQDFAVRFSALATAFNQLKQDHDSHVHGGVTSGPASTSTTIPSTADISPAKVENVKVP